MGFLSFLNNGYVDIEKGVEEYKNKEGSLLIDVRTIEEYSEGHIPGSINIPLDDIEDILYQISDKDAEIYLYCRSGQRSGKALHILKNYGYKNIKNIGGIIDYKGKLEK